MSALEVVAIIFTLTCVYLTSKQNILCWPFGIVGVIAFFLIFLSEELYFQTGLQVVFLTQSAYGWYMWNKGKGGDNLPVTSLEWKVVKDTSNVIAISLALVIFLIKNPSNLDFVDAVSSGLSILATWYLVHKKIEAWIVWMIVNILLFGVMLYQGIYLIAGLEVVLFIISLKAFISWKKNLKTDYV